MAESLELHPAAGAPGLYVAVHRGQELARAASPVVAAARVLLAEGHRPDTVLAVRHAGSPIIAMLGTLERMAAIGSSSDRLPGRSRPVRAPGARKSKAAARMVAAGPIGAVRGAIGLVEAAP